MRDPRRRALSSAGHDQWLERRVDSSPQKLKIPQCSQAEHTLLPDQVHALFGFDIGLIDKS